MLLLTSDAIIKGNVKFEVECQLLHSCLDSFFCSIPYDMELFNTKVQVSAASFQYKAAQCEQ